MSKYAIVLDKCDQNRKALIYIFGVRPNEENKAVVFDVPDYLRDRISVGDSFVEETLCGRNGTQKLIKPCTPIRKTIANSANNIKIKALLHVQLQKINKLSTITSNIVFSKDFGSIKIPSSLIPTLKKISTPNILADIEINNRQGCWFSNIVSWQIAEDSTILEVQNYQEELDPPYRLDESSLICGPYAGVIVDTTPGAGFIWSPTLVAIIETNDNLRPGMWYEFTVRIGENCTEFPIMTKYYAHTFTLLKKPILPTITPNEHKPTISFEVTGQICSNDKERYNYLRTNQLGNISCGLSSCPGVSSVAYGEEVCAHLSLIKNDTELALRIDRIEKTTDHEVGIVVKNDKGDLRVSVGHFLYTIAPHTRQFYDMIEPGDILELRSCYRNSEEKRVFSYSVFGKEGVSTIANNVYEGTFSLVFCTSITISDQNYNLFQSTCGLKFVDFGNNLLNSEQPQVAIVRWNSNTENPQWQISLKGFHRGNKQSKTVSTYQPLQSENNFNNNNRFLKSKPKPSARPGSSGEVVTSASHIRDVLTHRDCFCQKRLFEVLSKKTPNHEVENETSYRQKLLAVGMHEHQGGIIVVTFFVSSVLWVGTTFITAMFGPGYGELPREFQVGKWYQQILQSIKGIRTERRINLRVKYGEEWSPVDIVPDEPSITHVIENNGFRVVNTLIELKRYNNKYDVFGIHTILHNNTFGNVICFGEDHYCDDIDDDVDQVTYSGYVEPLSKPYKLGKFVILWRVVRKLEVIQTIPRVQTNNIETEARLLWDAGDFLPKERLVDMETNETEVKQKERKKKEKKMCQKYENQDRISKIDRITHLTECFSIIEKNIDILNSIKKDAGSLYATTMCEFNNKLRRKSQRIVIGAKFLFSILSHENCSIALKIMNEDDFAFLKATLEEHYSYLVNLPGIDISYLLSVSS